jgi:hypothetical protein
MTEPARDDSFEDNDPWSAATGDDAGQADAGQTEAEQADTGQADSGHAEAAPRAEEAPAEPALPPAPAEAALPPAPVEPALPPARAAGAVPEGLPDNWPGRDTIHEPPHPGYREAVPPPPRPVRPVQVRRRPEQPPGADLLNGFQRWVIRSSARSMRREIESSVRRTVRSARAEPEDIWGVATTEPPPDLTEAPECAWCPICRAARRMRESGGGLSSVSDAVASAVQDAFGALDGVLSRTTAASGHERPAEPGSHDADSAGDHDHAERAPDEPGDRG